MLFMHIIVTILDKRIIERRPIKLHQVEIKLLKIYFANQHALERLVTKIN